jgi:hypothetical protein
VGGKIDRVLKRQRRAQKFSRSVAGTVLGEIFEVIFFVNKFRSRTIAGTVLGEFLEGIFFENQVYSRRIGGRAVLQNMNF